MKTKEAGEGGSATCGRTLLMAGYPQGQGLARLHQPREPLKPVWKSVKRQLIFWSMLQTQEIQGSSLLGMFGYVSN